MEKQLEDMEQKLLNCRLAERDTFIIIIIQNAMMEGRIQKTTFQGEATVESLDPDTVTRLLHYLELNSQEQAFTMLVLKKNLRVSERFPYPVRVEAILELIDQFPKRKLEKMTRYGANLRCITTKKKVVMKRKKIRRMRVLSPQRQGNGTSLVALPRKPPMDKKAALKSKIQDILSGRSRFVIRKAPAAGSTRGKDSSNGGQTVSNRLEKAKENSPPSVSKSDEERKKNSPDPSEEEGKKTHGEKNGEDKKEQNVKGDSQEKQSSKKKGKGRKGKKGKGRGKKSNKEASEKDKKALKEFLDSFKGTRRLMLISTPSRDATLYVQQKEENEKYYCDLAIRKITVATIVEGSDATLTLQHYKLESESPLTDLSETFDSGLISLLRAELRLSSSDLFSMTVTDYDIKSNRVFEAPPSSSALFEYIDNFSSRHSEKEKERESPPVCSKDKEPEEENSLLRFMSKRRLLIISAPSEDDYSFQQQLSAIRGQECHLGIRHFVMLQLTGTGDKASGKVELFPLNGRSQSEVEPLSRVMVNNMREQLKISKEYFSMLIVGKDGDVKTWFPSPMWSLENIYDLVDSMELRLHEEMLQKRLGIHCPEDRGRGGSEAGHYGGRVEERY
ncbi:coiled-coil domain-containing protein 80 [Solea solea]|uniref:coiled-coil domain-containing protein 80 n=1 Tax=Solea solea TaxID=90069 RepID=UPI0027298560|nr:coiled-coil domain-containing protein 80 [Solea solea]